MAAEAFSDFFDPLVGTPEAADQFKASLARAVEGHFPDYLPADPYDRLERGLVAEVDRFTERQGGFSIAELRYWDDMGRKIKLGGVYLTVAALRAAGTHYRDLAVVPQDHERVEQSVRTATGYVLGLAMRNQDTALMNISAARRGMNPRDQSRRKLFAEWAGEEYITPGIDLTEVFTSTTDQNGQLTLSVRYRPLGAATGERCPATYARTETADGRTEASMWRYLQTIGGVTMSEIYPAQFPIAP
jgi:hypothetical protein